AVPFRTRVSSCSRVHRVRHSFPTRRSSDLLEYRLATDTTLAVRASIQEVVKTLAEAIVLVILVIFLFLHGWRSVLITALTLPVRSEEHTSELQSRENLVCRLLLEKKNKIYE